MAAVSRLRRSARTPAADVSAARSSSVPDLVFGSAATIIRSEAPTAEASAAAEPPPGVGSLELNAASRSRTDLSVSDMICIPLTVNRDYGGNGITQRNEETETSRGI